MTYDVEHLFTCLFAICTSYLIKYLIRSFDHFLVGFFVFLLLSFKSSFYILDTCTLSDTHFANIFFQSAVSLSIVLTVSLQSQSF